MFFTQEDYRKIEQWLQRNSVKDTEFQEALPLNGLETITLVQDEHNKKVFIKDLVDQIFKLGVSDFLNVTDKYEASYITLDEAIKLIPSGARKAGQVITFLNTDGNWQVYQFKGVLNQWNQLDLWEDLFDWGKFVVDSILPDEEDLTTTEPDSQGNAKMKLADKRYNPEVFSGLGHVILRKNLVEIEDKDTGKSLGIQNFYYQDLFKLENTIYEFNYDCTFNGATITIPKNCILLFKSNYVKNVKFILQDNTKIIGNGVTFYSNPDLQLIYSENSKNISISDVKFDIKGNTHVSYEYAGVLFRNCSSVTIEHCIFEGAEDGTSGFIGLATSRVDNIKVLNNSFYYFYKPNYWTSGQQNTAWATYFISISNACITGNYLYHSYSGIKLTGFIKNVIITNNTTEASITDGCDFAGMSAYNVSILNNTFYNCGDCGIEFKILFANAMHYDIPKGDINFEPGSGGYSVNEPRYFKNINISNNTITSHVGIKVWNQYSYTPFIAAEYLYLSYLGNSGEFNISNNLLNYYETSEGSGNPNSSVGVQLCHANTKECDFILKNNNIHGHSFGVYLVNSMNIEIDNNIVNSKNYTFYSRLESHYSLNCKFNYGNKVYNNKFISLNGPILYIGNYDTDLVFKDNKLYKLTITNNISAVVEDYGLNTILDNNISNSYLKLFINTDTGNIYYSTSFISRPTIISNGINKDTSQKEVIHKYIDLNYSGDLLRRYVPINDSNFIYYNTLLGCFLKVKEQELDRPCVLFRLIGMPNSTGIIHLSWDLDGLDTQTVHIKVDRVPISIADFGLIIMKEMSLLSTNWFCECDPTFEVKDGVRLYLYILRFFRKDYLYTDLYYNHVFSSSYPESILSCVHSYYKGTAIIWEDIVNKFPSSLLVNTLTVGNNSSSTVNLEREGGSSYILAKGSIAFRTNGDNTIRTLIDEEGLSVTGTLDATSLSDNLFRIIRDTVKETISNTEIPWNLTNGIYDLDSAKMGSEESSPSDSGSLFVFNTALNHKAQIAICYKSLYFRRCTSSSDKRWYKVDASQATTDSTPIKMLI